jgi:hypothetical protein
MFDSPIYDTPARKLRKDLNSKTPTKSAVKGASGLQSPSKATPASAKRYAYLSLVYIYIY